MIVFILAYAIFEVHQIGRNENFTSSEQEMKTNEVLEKEKRQIIEHMSHNVPQGMLDRVQFSHDETFRFAIKIEEHTGDPSQDFATTICEKWDALTREQKQKIFKIKLKSRQGQKKSTLDREVDLSCIIRDKDSVLLKFPTETMQFFMEGALALDEYKGENKPNKIYTKVDFAKDQFCQLFTEVKELSLYLETSFIILNQDYKSGFLYKPHINQLDDSFI